MSAQEDIPDARISPDQQAVVDRFLLDAVNDYKYDRIDLTLKKGANINAQDDKGFTPLMRAVNLGDAYAVKFILARGPDPFVRDKYNRTAFDLLPYVHDVSVRNQMTDAMLAALPDARHMPQAGQKPLPDATTPESGKDAAAAAGNAAQGAFPRRKSFNP